jgi:hypothetical protein
VSTEVPVVPPQDTKPVPDNNPYAFDSIVGVPARTARQIRHKATRFIADPESFRDYAKRAIVIHALIMDWQARNAQEPDKAKVAAESFLKITSQLMASPKGKK